MEIENKRIEVGGVTYELLPFSSEDGAKWHGAVMSSLADLDVVKLQGGDEGEALRAFRDVIKPFIDDHWMDFWRTCVKRTNVVAMAEGRESIQALDKIEATHMQRRAGARLMIMVEHFQAEFGDFLQNELRDLLARLARSVGDL